MKIIILSDNHYDSDSIFQVRNSINADLFIHCGDSLLPYKKLRGFAAVRGNNDYDSGYPSELILEAENHRIFVTHGHRYMWFGNYERLVETARSADCDIVCFGHTHIYTDITINGVRLLNPGSIWNNRDYTDPSYMILSIDGNDISTERISYHK